MLTKDEELRIFGGAEGVAALDRYIADLVEAAPPLTPRQRDRLRTLLRPAPAEPVISHQRRRTEPRNAKAA